ncbi:hypothetical protein LWM68_42230 [Niabella sp. W65]|nr:hypothetical protein [Niabella sp. W65]MCH7368770.1 hypothetical protein [Niabella sp. W65]ULT44346.1 hypothetical protein KRR40_13930 [Niabella sp. I65]
MGKKILAVYFSQSGQTRAIVESFLRPVVADGNEVEYLEIKTVHQFPFPWSVPVFLIQFLSRSILSPQPCNPGKPGLKNMTW